jgi:hypothetical protein
MDALECGGHLLVLNEARVAEAVPVGLQRADFSGSPYGLRGDIGTLLE